MPDQAYMIVRGPMASVRMDVRSTPMEVPSIAMSAAVSPPADHGADGHVVGLADDDEAGLSPRVYAHSGALKCSAVATAIPT